jgi:hypothetical protein
MLPSMVVDRVGLKSRQLLRQPHAAVITKFYATVPHTWAASSTEISLAVAKGRSLLIRNTWQTHD